MNKKKESISYYLFKKWVGVCKRKRGFYCSHQMEKELCNLNPGVQKEKIIREYYLGKIRLGLLILSVGGIMVLLSVCNMTWNGDLERERYIERSKEGKRKTVILDAEIGDEVVEDIVIEIEERILSDDEKYTRLEEVRKLLLEKVLGENENPQQIMYPLNLMDTWEDSGISIFWTSSNYKVLKEDGTLETEGISKEGTDVILTAVLEYEGMQIKEQIPLRIYPSEKTTQETLKGKVFSLVEEYNQRSKNEEYLELPKALGQTDIIWEEARSGKVTAMVGGTMVMFFGVLWGRDREIHKRYEERNRRLVLEYSEFVSKLQLLICSGMSVRNAIFHLGREYKKRKEHGENKRYVYEELLVVIRKMENGMSETEAYDYFGKRCDLICYKKLMSIILQNVKRGTEGLKESLLTESKNAFEERKQIARRMGEEAETKLLLPMMLMMGIVLIIIVVPAYFSFGGI